MVQASRPCLRSWRGSTPTFWGKRDHNRTSKSVTYLKSLNSTAKKMCAAMLKRVFRRRLMRSPGSKRFMPIMPSPMLTLMHWRRSRRGLRTLFKRKTLTTSIRASRLQPMHCACHPGRPTSIRFQGRTTPCRAGQVTTFGARYAALG